MDEKLDQNIQQMFSTNVVFPTESQTNDENDGKMPSPEEMQIKFPNHGTNSRKGDEEEEEEEESHEPNETNESEANEKQIVIDNNQSDGETKLEKQNQQKANKLLDVPPQNKSQQQPNRKRPAYTAQRPNRNSNSQQDPDNIASLSTKFLNGEKVNSTDPELLAAVVLDLEEQRDQLMMDGSFSKSLKAQKVVDAAKAQQLDAVKLQTQNEQQETLNMKKETLQSEYDNFQQQMKEKEQQLEANIHQQIEALKEKHIQELEDHDQGWQSEIKARQFNRSSQRLRVLRTQQNLLMNAKRFDEAAQVCKIADGVAAQETQESHRQMLTAFKNSRAKLEEKQVNEMDTLMKACEVRRGEFKYQKETMEKPFINRLNYIQIEEKIASDPERLWVLKHRNDGDQITAYSATARGVRPNMTKKNNVAEYNTLPLPPLPVPPSPRKGQNNNQQNNA
ncbi:hypothetical protein TRFO_41724 [Tritrichomonas foetus]|uniref:Uncharacterized protein n=1 Tax=Tritrichomonas foetus TaxID=1144522 RepID=A0A1J4L3N9_9EUKA|nr:hypothetical protein TRFO_41724 [Tritrichomonas foetus]|eukprot:OHT16588.1 hypothetical protein TRFO_41724 [Tritrichomonas foetus]